MVDYLRFAKACKDAKEAMTTKPQPTDALPPEDMTDDELKAAISFHERQAMRLKSEGAKLWRLRLRIGRGEPVDRRMLAELHERRASRVSPASAAPVVDNPDKRRKWVYSEDVMEALANAFDSMKGQTLPVSEVGYAVYRALLAVPEFAAAATAAPQVDDCDAARVQRLEAQMQGLLNSLATSQQEVERLRAGNFTPQEFQNLCHNLDERDREVFVAGCLEYQRKPFGDSAAPVEQSIDPIGDFVDQVWKLTNDRDGWSRMTLRGVVENFARQFTASASSTSARAAAREIETHLGELPVFAD